MKIQCEYCGQMIPETAQICPYCGAANKRVKRVAHGVPTTIQELRAYCKAHNLPLQDMRVFIGEDYRGARAFGIYQDKTTGNFIVYKNKENGIRAVRYEGNDEAYAVNELYLKIKERVDMQKNRRRPQNSSKFLKYGVRGLILQIITVILISILVLAFWNASGPSSGYYVYQDDTYYYDSSRWYEWDDAYGEWNPTQAAAELTDNPDDYWESSRWSALWDVDDFEESSWYQEMQSEDEDWEDDDWDYDWDDGDSWDSDYDDWDSDW